MIEGLLREMELIFRSGARVTVVGRITMKDGQWDLKCEEGYPNVIIFDHAEVVAIVVLRNVESK